MIHCKRLWKQLVLCSYLLLVVNVFFVITAGAQEPLPKVNSYVTDLTNTLSPEQKTYLENELSQFEKTKGSQLIVVIIPTTGSEAIEQYGIRLADSLKVGRKGIDDGAILIIAKDDHTVRIEVGYGLEGVLTDYASKRIIEDYLVPNFRSGEYYEGIRTGIEAMIALIQGEQLPPPSESSKKAPNIPLGSIIPVLFIVGFFLRVIFGRILGGFLTGGAVFLITWIALGAISLALIFSVIAFIMIITGMINPTGRSYHRGGGYWMGGGGFSGGSGGGFGGGGGRFGGGGASGRW